MPRPISYAVFCLKKKTGKPLTQGVNTHHHFDHSGGIRAAGSEVLAVVTHKGNVAFFQNAVGRAHTIVPDALAKNPKQLIFFFNDTPTTEIYTLSLHDALPISIAAS